MCTPLVPPPSGWSKTSCAPRRSYVGGKTGTGDNRLHASRAQHVRPLSRTATFVFYVGDRFFGVLTAFVPGADAGRHRFTGALPIEVLRLFAPSISHRW